MRGAVAFSLQDVQILVASFGQQGNALQGHAVDTYDEFVEANKEKLQNLPPPLVALKYYKGGDLYYFDMLQTKGGTPRRPECRYG